MAWKASLFSFLVSSTPFWEGVEYSAEAIVVIGAIGEFLTEFEYVLKGDDNKTLRHRFGKLAAIVLIAGLAIELGALVRTNQLSSRMLAGLYKQTSAAESQAVAARKEAIQSDDRAKNAFDAAARAQNRADSAEKQSVNAIKRAAVNAIEAARLNKIAQDESLARVKIEEQLALRRLTPEQRDKLCPTIRALPSGIVFIESAIGDFDGDQFRKQFVDLFSICGKPLAPDQTNRVIYDETPQGVEVAIRSQYDPVATQATALILALNSAGIKTEAIANINTNMGQIRLIIGVNPAFK
jgi:hypothetical protein